MCCAALYLRKLLREVVCDTVGSEFAGIWVFPRKGLVFLRMRHFHVKCGIFVDGLVACVA